MVQQNGQGLVPLVRTTKGKPATFVISLSFQVHISTFMTAQYVHLFLFYLTQQELNYYLQYPLTVQFSTIFELQVHQNLKPYRCDICDKTFGQRGTLTRHRSAVHEKRKDHKCKYPGCEKKFSSRWTLSVHEVSLLAQSFSFIDGSTFIVQHQLTSFLQIVLLLFTAQCTWEIETFFLLTTWVHKKVR